MELPKDYPMAVAVALAINLHCHAASWRVGKSRKEVFNKQFMEKEFGLLHRSQLGEEIVEGGTPDTGNGFYSQKLSYKDWYKFNVLQRIHLNYLENVSFATTATLAAGLFEPKAAAYCGMVFMLGRLFYGAFYEKKQGFKGKLKKTGAFLCIVGLLANTAIFATRFVNNYWNK